MKYPVLAAELMTLNHDVLVMWDGLRRFIGDFAAASVADLDGAISEFIDWMALDELDRAYTEKDKSDFLQWSRSMLGRWNSLPAKFRRDKNNANMIPLLL